MKSKNTSKGLGDTVDKITTKTGIKKAVKKVFGDDCGCEERRHKLNRLFPYKTKECLTEEEYLWCDDYFNTYRSVISRDEQTMMLSIFNRVFNERKQPSSCGSCVKDLYNTINKLYKEYAKSEKDNRSKTKRVSKTTGKGNKK